MTWPTDSEPRFKVSSITGYSGEGGIGARVNTIHLVFDRACLHRQVYESMPGEHGKETARLIAAWLNADDLGLIEPPHGRSYVYQRYGCRCDYCRGAQCYKHYVYARLHPKGRLSSPARGRRT